MPPVMPDVNVLIDAWWEASPFHARARGWLESTVESAEPLVLSTHVVTGAVRILTSPRIPQMSWPVDDVLDLVDQLTQAPGVSTVHPGRRHWELFTSLCRTLGVAGNVVPDCHLAALALERGARFVSRDQFFATVPGLDWIDLPAG